MRQRGRKSSSRVEETHKHIVVLNASGGYTVIKSGGGYPSSSFTEGVDRSRRAEVIPSISEVSLAEGIILRAIEKGRERKKERVLR